jgi:chromosome segregation ATPase
MRTREKVAVLLIFATLILGGLIAYSLQGNEVESNFVRWQYWRTVGKFLSSPINSLFGDAASGGSGKALLYGGLGVFGLIVMIVLLKLFRDGELMALRQHLRTLMSAKSETESLLQQEMWKGKHERQAKDSAMKDLESSIERIELLLSDLSEKEQLLKTREAELRAVRTEEELTRSEAGTSNGQSSDRLLKDELRKKNEYIQAKDAAIKELEQRLRAKTSLWESQLRQKDLLLKAQRGECEQLQSQAMDLGAQLRELEGAKKRAEDLLEDELRKKKQILEASESASKAEESRLTEKIRALEAQATDRERVLKGRESDIANFRHQLAEANAGKQSAERALQEQLEQAERDRQDGAGVVRELEQRLTATIQGLNSEVEEKGLLIHLRDGEIDALRSQLKIVAARLNEKSDSQGRTEELLRDELRQEKQRSEKSDSAIRELQERFNKDEKNWEKQLSQLRDTLQGRDGELKIVKNQVASIAGQLREAVAAKARVEESLTEHLQRDALQRENRDGAIRELEERYGNELKVLADQLGDKDESLKIRDRELGALRNQVKSLAEQLSKVESAKERAAALLQDKIKNEKQLKASSDSAQRELEQNYKTKIAALEQQLGEKLQSVGSRDSQVVALKSELTAANRRMGELAAAREKAESLFQEAVREKADIALSKDTALTELEESFSGKIRAFESELNEKALQLKGREAELAAFKNQVAELAAAKEQTTRALQDELRKRNELLQEKEAAAKALEIRFANQVRALESELVAREELLGGREAEVAALAVKVAGLTSQLNDEGTAKDQSTRSLQEELRQRTAMLQEKDAAAKSLETRFTDNIRSLERELKQRQEALTGRETELAALTAKISSLSAQLAEVGASNDQAARHLREDIKKKNDLLLSKEAAMKGIEQRLTGTVRSLESQLNEKQELLNTRELELEALMSKVSTLAGQVGELEAARERSERLLQEEVREKSVLLEAKESSIGDIEERLSGRVKILERQLSEKQQLLESGGSELGETRERMLAMSERLKELETAKTELEDLLREERQKNDKSLIVLGTKDEGFGEDANGHSNGLENLISERDELVKARDKLITNLMTELKEKKTQLARHEIEVWQGIERRGVWKNRLSKIGIRLKD